MKKFAWPAWVYHLTHPSLAQLWGITLLAGIFIFLNTHPIRPHDFWWHMRAGQEIAATGQIPQYDTFSSTMYGAPYNYTVYWMAQVAMYYTYSLGGPALVVFLHSTIITAGYALLFRLCHMQSDNRRIATLCVFIAAALGIHSWNVRPQTVTFLLGPMYLYTIAQYTRRPRRALLALFPVGMLVWVNSHGSFPIGLILLGLWLIDAWTTRHKTPRPLWPDALAALTLTTLAGLLNPRGIGILHYLVGMGQNPAVQQLVPEWAAPTFAQVDGATFYSLLLVSSLILLLSPRRPRPAQLLAFVMFGALSWRTSRGIPWFGIILAPILADSLPPLFAKSGVSLTEKPPTSTNLRVNQGFLALIILVVVGTLPWFKAHLPLPPLKAGLISAETPLQATDYMLQVDCPTPIFNEVGFGSYLIWAAQPNYPVFVDPRIDLYPLELWLDYIRISAAAPSWEEKLEHYGARTLLLNPQTQAGLVAAARESQQWREVYQDEVSVILITRGEACTE